MDCLYYKKSCKEKLQQKDFKVGFVDFENFDVRAVDEIFHEAQPLTWAEIRDIINRAQTRANDVWNETVTYTYNNVAVNTTTNV